MKRSEAIRRLDEMRKGHLVAAAQQAKRDPSSAHTHTCDAAALTAAINALRAKEPSPAVEEPCERHDLDKHDICLVCGYDKRADL